MTSLIEKLHAVHESLAAAKLPHAFGGAIALAYCTQEPRGTRDLDVNIFVQRDRAADALGALPDGVKVAQADIDQVLRDGQTRVWWDETPVDVFLNNLPLHDRVAKGVRWRPLAGRDVPLLDCTSLALFKAFFNRTKDWADLEAIAEATPGDIADAADWLEELDPDDQAIARMRQLAAQPPAAP
ncbi:MAG: hypothetical protein WAP35_00790 [Solirubrobacterales bacterium]